MGITFGMNPFVFAFGDDAFADFLAGVQFLVRFRKSTSEVFMLVFPFLSRIALKLSFKHIGQSQQQF